MENLDNLRLGVTDGLLRLGSSRDHRELTPVLVRQARRSVAFHTLDLDPAAYDTREMQEALSEFARRNRFTSVRLLVQDPTRAVNEGHAILRLAQQLSSKIQLRVPGEDDKSFSEAFVVFDDIAYIRRPAGDLYAAEAGLNAPIEARRLQTYFDRIWERAEADPQLRRLFL